MTTFSSVYAWDERKNPDGLIRAFLHAFNQDDHVQLVIKSYAGSTTAGEIREKVRRVVGSAQHPNPPSIVVINEDLTRDEMLSLIAHSDVYVCSSRGEGWSLPVTEAAMYGVPSIISDNSALQEQGLGYRIDCVVEPVWGMTSGNYTWPQVWETPRIMGMAHAMRAFADNPDEGAMQATISSRILSEKYNTTRAAEQAKRAVAPAFSLLTPGL